ncbi:methyltransferase domain-containing protein [Streptomyces flaveolus]|uniref:methyltransferase domain-containing protein n=1 Tax=Streptomyces flaveolus TaxID=67297 RepID=UPI0033B223BA
MSLFAGTASYHRQFRPGISEDVAEALDQAAPSRSGGRRRLLDVGTGTGLVAEALLDRFDDIIATDSDGDMLAAAESALRPEPSGQNGPAKQIRPGADLSAPGLTW